MTKKHTEITKTEVSLPTDFDPQVILGGFVDEPSKDYKAEVEKIPESERVTEIEYTSANTGNKGMQVIDRRGTTDEKLAMVLSDKDATQDRKDGMLSMYLFERGKESASFLLDLMLYKGAHAKDTNKFKSQIRFDFTIFANLFCNFLIDDAQSTLNTLLPGTQIVELEGQAFEYLKNAKKDKKNFTLTDFVRSIAPDMSKLEIIMIEKAIRSASQSQLIKKELDAITEERERSAGKFNYLDKEGKTNQKAD